MELGLSQCLEIVFVCLPLDIPKENYQSFKVSYDHRHADFYVAKVAAILGLKIKSNCIHRKI